MRKSFEGLTKLPRVCNFKQYCHQSCIKGEASYKEKVLAFYHAIKQFINGIPFNKYQFGTSLITALRVF